MYQSDLIEHRDRKRQIIAFEGLEFGNITPMDIDGCIEYKNKAVILLEYKLRGALMPEGQKLCLRRLVDDLQKAGKEACCILCDHDAVDPMEDVNAGAATVRAVYYRHTWYTGVKGTVRQYIERFLEGIN